MASDLSTLIQDGLCTTLQNLLGIDAKLNEITQVHPNDLKDLELLEIHSEFVFEHLTTVLQFIVPAKSASLIFNIQMGDMTAEPSLSLDDDTTDAINEFISTVSGGLTTTMNGADLSDLGQVKFNIKNSEILKSNTLTDFENMYRFSIHLEETEILIFILFDSTIIPYIKDLTLNPVTQYPEEKIKQPEVEEESETPTTSKLDEDTKPEETNKTDNSEDENKKEISKKQKIKELLTDNNPENKKLKILVMGVGGLLILTIIAGVVMYFMGMFDPEPVVVKKPDLNTTKEKLKIVKYKTIKKVDFKITDINIPRLNTRLAQLTKANVLTQAELDKEILEEKDRIAQLNKEKELLAFAKKNKEEPLKNTKLIQTQIVTKNKIVQQKKVVKTNKLRFILSTSLKYKFFKDLVREIDTKQARISICTNQNGRTTIFIGPFENNTLQSKMENLIKTNNPNISTTISNITQKEFDTRCNF
jgi:hypothetical protein